MCIHLDVPALELHGSWHIFVESGCKDNHTYLVCDICGDIEDLGEVKE